MKLNRKEFRRKNVKTKEQYKRELRDLRAELDQAKRQVERSAEGILKPLGIAISESRGHFYRTGLFYDDEICEVKTR